MNPNSPSDAVGSKKCRRFWHLPYLIGSFIGSLIVIIALDPFAGMGTGILVTILFGALIVSHLVSAIIGYFLANPTWRRIAIVLSVSLLPAISFALTKAHDAWYLGHRAVYDRFLDSLANPIPASVAELSFIPLKEQFEGHLMFRFSIAPNELDALISAKGFKRIDAAQFRRPDDLFTHPEYLPLKEPASYYILNDIAAGYPDKGIGEGYTLKVSADRQQVIFRQESAAYYLHKYWEDAAITTQEKQFLSSLAKSKSNSAVETTTAP